MQHKRYIVFGFDKYYPDGGMRDVLHSYDLKQDAIECANIAEFEFVQVFDRVEGLVIFTQNITRANHKDIITSETLEA